MKISDVRVRIVKKDDSKLKAVASVTFDDCFVVHDIKVIEGNEGYFIAMPSRKTADGEYKDIAHPIKTETREELIKIIDDILLKSESQIEAYKAGRSNLFDYFVGQVMKNTRGKANPVMTKEILNEKLNG